MERYSCFICVHRGVCSIFKVLDSMKLKDAAYAKKTRFIEIVASNCYEFVDREERESQKEGKEIGTS